MRRHSPGATWMGAHLDPLAASSPLRSVFDFGRRASRDGGRGLRAALRQQASDLSTKPGDAAIFGSPGCWWVGGVVAAWTSDDVVAPGPSLHHRRCRQALGGAAYAGVGYDDSTSPGRLRAERRGRPCGQASPLRRECAAEPAAGAALLGELAALLGRECLISLPACLPLFLGRQLARASWKFMPGLAHVPCRRQLAPLGHARGDALLF